MSDAVSMRWVRDTKGYDIEEGSEAGAYIVARGGEPIRYEVTNDALWDIVNTRRHPEDYRKFADKWGFLWSSGSRERLSHVWSRMKRIQEAAELVEQKQWVGFESMVGRQLALGRRSTAQELIRYAPGGDRLWLDPRRRLEAQGVQLRFRFARTPGYAEPSLFLEPENLISFCWIELMQRAAGARLMRCQKCGRLFPADEGEGSRPTSRKYCSARCRLAMHRHGP